MVKVSVVLVWRMFAKSRLILVNWFFVKFDRDDVGDSLFFEVELVWVSVFLGGRVVIELVVLSFFFSVFV